MLGAAESVMVGQSNCGSSGVLLRLEIVAAFSQFFALRFVLVNLSFVWSVLFSVRVAGCQLALL